MSVRSSGFISRLFFGIALVLFLVPALALFAGDAKVLRDPKSTPCAVYLGSLIDTSVGVEVAKLDEADIRLKIPALKDALRPKTIFVDPNKGKPYRDLEKLKEDLERDVEAGKAQAAVDYPIIYVVGTPMFGNKGRNLKKVVEDVLADLNLEHPVRVKVISRPQTYLWRDEMASTFCRSGRVCRAHGSACGRKREGGGSSRERSTGAAATGRTGPCG